MAGNNEVDFQGVKIVFSLDQLLDALVKKIIANPNIIGQFVKAIVSAPAFLPAVRTTITELARTVPSLFGATGNPPKGSTAKSSGR